MKVRQTATLLEGLDKDRAKKIVKAIKDSKLKVQSAIQGESVRVTGKKRDDLQEVMSLLKEGDFGVRVAVQQLPRLAVPGSDGGLRVGREQARLVSRPLPSRASVRLDALEVGPRLPQLMQGTAKDGVHELIGEVGMGRVPLARHWTSRDRAMVAALDIEDDGLRRASRERCSTSSILK